MQQNYKAAALINGVGSLFGPSREGAGLNQVKVVTLCSSEMIVCILYTVYLSIKPGRYLSSDESSCCVAALSSGHNTTLMDFLLNFFQRFHLKYSGSNSFMQQQTKETKHWGISSEIKDRFCNYLGVPDTI